ncbi:MAG: hypothetical protein P9L94_02190 [Candidatus Hinthialibacter antarcticus]|nr:hypothetical protein [Candidatus Hinthialibacter antarcticus]
MLNKSYGRIVFILCFIFFCFSFLHPVVNAADWPQRCMVWSETSISKTSVLSADGKLVLLTGQGELLFVEPSPEKFNTISRAQVIGGKCWTEPAIANGKLFLRNAQGILLCLDIRST